MNARSYDPQLGQFISPDTLVPDATQLMDFNRYAYARGNPMKYNDPSGHCIWDLCIGEIGLVELLAAAGGTAAFYAYVNSPAGQAAIEHAAQAFDNLTASKAAQESVPLPAPTKPQITGTPLNPDDTTTIQATTPLGNSVTAPLLSDPLPTQQKGSNIVYAKPSVALQPMGGAVSDAISANKGYHINTGVPGAELSLRPGADNTIVISPIGQVKVDAGKYVGAVNTLLRGQTDKVNAQLRGIINQAPSNSWQTREAQELIKMLEGGKFTVISK